MIILKESNLKKATPYMLRNDGVLLDCGIMHPYIFYNVSDTFSGNLDILLADVENIFSWFYDNTNSEATKKYIRICVKGLNKYKSTSLDETIFDVTPDIYELEDEGQLETFLTQLNLETNQEFCRVRTSNKLFGGTSDDIYFRISSIGFNWFELIWNVVAYHANDISTITICKDSNTFKGKFEPYMLNGIKLDHLQLDDFLTLSGNPVIEKFTTDSEMCEEALSRLANKKSMEEAFEGSHPKYLYGFYKGLLAEGILDYDMKNILNTKNQKLMEDIEKHDILNPKLWNEDNTLKPEVEEKIKLIVDNFLDGLKENEIKINVTDIKLVGSNCSYNYNKDSDLDVHIVADTESLECPDNLYPLLYSAYRSIWNGKFDVEFYGIPVELFVETSDTEQMVDPAEAELKEARQQTALRSNGVYSVMHKKWIKEPVAADIPEIDREAFEKEFKKWEDRYFNLIEGK